MPDLKPCPFCGGTDIRYSLKITGHFDVHYHAAMYCNKCHCYGARTLTKTVRNEDYEGRRKIENNAEVQTAAIEAWNQRAPEIVKVETFFYDKEETFPDCTVQVLTNTKTGDVSVGWRRNDG